MKHHYLFFLLLLCAAMNVGCTTPSHLVFHQSTVIGADAAANTETGQVSVAFGYDRQTNTLIPKTLAQRDASDPEGPGEENEAMSVVSASDVKIKWLGLHEVTEQFATGKAARNLARDPNALGQILNVTVPTNKPAP